jgi:hypothetical protein
MAEAEKKCQRPGQEEMFFWGKEVLTAYKSGNRKVAIIFDDHVVSPYSSVNEEDTLSERQYREHRGRVLPFHAKADTSRRLRSFKDRIPKRIFDVQESDGTKTENGNNTIKVVCREAVWIVVGPPSLRGKYL